MTAQPDWLTEFGYTHPLIANFFRRRPELAKDLSRDDAETFAEGVEAKLKSIGLFQDV
jgi:hypothetical protein